MPDPRSILERADRLAGAFPPPADGFERLARYQERRRKARRMRAAGFTLLLVTVTFGWLAWSLTNAERHTPAHEFEGSSPSDVSTRSIVGTCVSVGQADRIALAQELTLEVSSHLLVSFNAEWAGLDPVEEGRLALELVGPAGKERSNAWTFRGEPNVSTSGTVTWSFESVAPGAYSVTAVASVGPSAASGSVTALSAGLENCALTVFVVPGQGV
jgi:hypothetical protein